MDKDEKTCMLCSSKGKRVVLEKFNSQYLCPSSECPYSSAIWEIAAEHGDLSLLSAIYKNEVPFVSSQSKRGSPKQVVENSNGFVAEKKRSPKRVFSPKRKSVRSPRILSDKKNDISELCAISDKNCKAARKKRSSSVENRVILYSPSRRNSEIVMVEDGICEMYKNFVIWPNREARCWLNSTLALLLHSRSIRAFMESHIAGDCQIVKIFNDYKDILNDVNSKSLTPLTLVKVKKQLHAMQEYAFNFLNEQLCSAKSEPNSPAFTIPLLLKEHEVIKNMFEMKHCWSLECQKCYARWLYHGIKTVVSFEQLIEDFNLSSPLSMGKCNRCMLTEQERRLNFDKLPESVIFHFKCGFSTCDFLNYDFENQGFTYVLKGFILYTEIQEEKHFVTWVRDIKNNLWMNCDDLQSGFHCFSPIPPQIKPSEVHIAMWERIANSGVKVESRMNKNISEVKGTQELLRNIEIDLGDSSTQNKTARLLTGNKSDAYHNSPKELRKAAKDEESKFDVEMTASFESPAPKQLNISSEEGSLNHSQLNLSPFHDPSHLQNASSEPVRDTTDHTASAYVCKAKRDNKSEIKSSEKEKACRFVDIKLPSFETSFHSFSSMKKPKISIGKDGTLTCRSIKISQFPMVQNNVKVMLENIFAQNTPASPPVSEKTCSPITPSKEEKKEDSISISMTGERSVSDDVTYTEFVEPDGTKIMKLNDSKISDTVKINGGNISAASSQDSSNHLRDIAMSPETSGPRKTRSLISVSPNKVKCTSEQAQKALRPKRKKSVYQTRRKSKSTKIKTSEAFPDEVETHTLLTDDEKEVSESEGKSNSVTPCVESYTKNEVLQKNSASSPDQSSNNTQKRKSKVLVENCDGTGSNDIKVNVKATGGKKLKHEMDPIYIANELGENNDSPLYKSCRTYVKKQTSDEVIQEQKVSHVEPASETVEIASVAAELNVSPDSTQEVEGCISEDIASKQVYKYFSEKIIKNMTEEREALGNSRPKMSSVLTSNAVTESLGVTSVESNTKVKDSGNKSPETKNKKGKNDSTETPQRSSASYNLRGKPKVSSMGKVKRLKMERNQTEDSSNDEWLMLPSEEDEEEWKDIDFAKPVARSSRAKASKSVSSGEIKEELVDAGQQPKAKLTKRQSNIKREKAAVTSESATNVSNNKSKANTAKRTSKVSLTLEGHSPTKCNTANEILKMCLANSKSTLTKKMKTTRKTRSSVSQQSLSETLGVNATDLVEEEDKPPYDGSMSNKGKSPVKSNDSHTPGVYISLSDASTTVFKKENSSQECLNSPYYVHNRVPVSGANVTSKLPNSNLNAIKIEPAISSNAANQTNTSIYRIIPASPAFKTDSNTKCFISNIKNPHLGNLTTIQQFTLSPVKQGTPGNTHGVTMCTTADLKKISESSPSHSPLKIVKVIPIPNTPGRLPIPKQLSFNPVARANELKPNIDPTFKAVCSSAQGSRKIESDSKVKTFHNKSLKNIEKVTQAIQSSQNKLQSINNDSKPSFIELGNNVTLTPIGSTSPTNDTDSSRPETLTDIKNFISKMKTGSECSSETSSAKRESPKIVHISTSLSSSDETDSPKDTSRKTQMVKSAFPQLKPVFFKSSEALDLSQVKQEMTYISHANQRTFSVPHTEEKLESKVFAKPAGSPALRSVLSKTYPNAGALKKTPQCTDIVISQVANVADKKPSTPDITINDFTLSPSETLSRLYQSGNKSAS